MSDLWAEAGTEEWADAAADLHDDGSEIDWDREEQLREVIGEQPDLPDTDNLEDADAALLDSVVAGFRARAGKEAGRQAEVTLADCYVVLCFATQAQREAYLRGKGWTTIGRRYIDGRVVAAREGIDLPPDPEWPQTRRDHTWDSLAMTVEENRALPE